MEGRGDRKVDSLLDALSCRGLAERRLATVACRRGQNGSKEDPYAGEGVAGLGTLVTPPIRTRLRAPQYIILRSLQKTLT